MAFNPLNPTQIPLVLAWCSTSCRGGALLHRQVIGGREIDAWLQLDARDANTRIYLYEDEIGGVQGAIFLGRQHAGSHEVQVGWVVAGDVTRTTLRRMMFEGLDLAFSESDVQRVTWDLMEDGCLQVDPYRKFGFSIEGRFRQSFQDGDARRDVVRLGLLRSAWLAAREGLKSRLVHAGLQKSDGVRYVIQVLTDAGSWISPYVDELAEEWVLAGHTVRIAHRVEQALPADFCFCLSFSRIVSAEVRKQYRHTLVVHESELPDGRGWAPMTWQILEGKNRIPVTLIEAVDAVDAGPIYLQEWITLNGTELNPEWRLLQAQATLDLCMQWVKAYPAIVDRARPQTGAGSVYARRRPTDSRLDPSKTLAEQFNLLRVVDNDQYPAYFEMAGVRYKISIKKWGEKVS
ncbi:formyltransferase family protein [Curvibacter sp. APW13]|uniref:formyltransferase family protein n=1 Tax=Curvibacter sp. APW13 TaxID=3077236 RepID=UPI0028DE26EB|nr:formyltransferase family protein [Curvibacter sp. APW13]MDT8993101.1 formyltransferase family protein [Curvibacter sp. APW13]